MRAGDTAGPADAAIAVRIADRELERLAKVGRPRWVRAWQWVHVFAATALALGSVRAAFDRDWLWAVLRLVLATVIATSAARGRRRLARDVERVTRSRAANAAALAPDGGPRQEPTPAV